MEPAPAGRLRGAIPSSPAQFPWHKPSRAGESHPHPLTEPYVTVSRHTALLVQPHQAALLFPKGSSHLWLAGQSEPDEPAPSLRSHYRTFITTTSWSAPVPRIGTQTLEGGTPLGFSLSIGATGSHVPCRSSKPGSRRLYAGRRPGGKRVIPRTYPGID